VTGTIGGMDDTGPISIEEMYGYSDELSAAMDAALDQSLGPRGPDMLFELAGELGVRRGSRVLDVGCRDGKQALELARRYGSTTIGVEPVAANLARGRALLGEARANEPDIASRVSLVQGRIETLPFPDASMDLVWARDMLIHVPDLSKGLRECRRVLVAGGHMLVFQMFATAWLEPDEAARLWPPLGVVAETTDPSYFERCLANAELTVVRAIELGSEWREWREEQGDGLTSRQLLRAARLLRDRDRFIRRFGTIAYGAELGNCLWGVYQMIGKLSPRIYVLEAP
jgi:sarcosine/dimethylglycine N-methyltransferase